MNDNHGDTLPPLSIPSQSPTQSGGTQPSTPQIANNPVSSFPGQGVPMVDPSAVNTPLDVSLSDDISTTSPTDLGPPAFPMTSATYSGTPQIADDVDLIEKEWVDKAKAIVDQTKADPYLQNKQMSKFKADYLKKRYNRDLKVTED